MSLVIPAYAQCPVCIITVGGGMYFAKKLGVDDFLVSIWISALNTAISFWLAPKLKIKFLKNPWILSLIMLGLTLFYFHFTDQTGGSAHRLIGIDKIVLGQGLGLLIMFFANWFYAFVKKKNNNKTIFPYAKVAFPFFFILISTLIFKFAFKL